MQKMVERDAEFVTSGSKVLRVDGKHQHYFFAQEIEF
jgi:hypothetical protein